MKEDLSIQPGITIPAHELEITASRAQGPGGQYVNKVSTKITIRWNVTHTTALSDIQKELVLKKLHSEITHEGDILIASSSSRSQYQNKQSALKLLAAKVRAALKVSKKRVASTISRSIKESRIKRKKERSALKRLRKIVYE
jgi:ribosome-associated protein